MPSSTLWGYYGVTFTGGLSYLPTPTPSPMSSVAAQTSATGTGTKGVAPRATGLGVGAVIGGAVAVAALGL